METDDQDPIESRRRVINQMRDMHSDLAAGLTTWARVADLSLLGLSVVAASVAFGGSSGTFSVLGFSANRTTWLGWFSIVVVISVLIEYTLGLRARAAAHKDSVRKLSQLLQKYRDPDTFTPDQLSESYKIVMDTLSPIPNRKFNRLKARHLEKKKVSQFLSKHPGVNHRAARKKVRSEAERIAGL